MCQIGMQDLGPIIWASITYKPDQLHHKNQMLVMIISIYNTNTKSITIILNWMEIQFLKDKEIHKK